MEYTTAGEGILFLSTAPLFTAGIVALLGREKFRKRNWAGAALALGGVALVVFYAPAYDPAYAPNRLLGNTLMLFSAALYGLYMVVVRDWLHRWGALRVLAGGYTVALLLSLPLSLVPFLAIDWSALSLTHWGSLGFTMVVAGVYGFVVWYAVIKRTSSARTAVFQYLIPPATVIFAWLLLGEQLTGLQILGMGLTLAGVFWARPLQTPLRRLPTRTV
jgi:drug/metabolite transporter (DMT)-like permease